MMHIEDSATERTTDLGALPTTFSSRELVSRALRGMPIPRPVHGPLAVHYCAHLAGVSLRDYTLNPRTLADCVLRYYETFRPDAVWLSADTWVSAQAMGASVGFPSGNQPMAGMGEPCIRSAADIDRIPPPDPGSQGRWPIMLESLRYIRKALGEDVFVVACFDQYPFSLACAMMGIEQVMMRIMDDRSMVDALMEKSAEYAVAYALALADNGADMLSGGDSPASLIGPRLYHAVALPYEQRVIASLKSRCSKPISLHICGNATPLLAEMAASGADVLELDQRVAISAACGAVGPDIAIWGNLDPVSLLAHGSPDQVRMATKKLLGDVRACGHKRLVVSSGCTLAAETPPANLHAMFETVRNSSVVQ